MSAVLMEWSEWNYVHCRDFCPTIEYCGLEASNCTIIRFRTEAMLLESSSPYTHVSNQTELCPACKGIFADSHLSRITIIRNYVYNRRIHWSRVYSTSSSTLVVGVCSGRYFAATLYSSLSGSWIDGENERSARSSASWQLYISLAENYDASGL